MAKPVRALHLLADPTLAQKIAAWHEEWVKTATFTVDPQYTRPDSQYPELVEDVTPTPESDAVYWEGVRKIFEEHTDR